MFFHCKSAWLLFNEQITGLRADRKKKAARPFCPFCPVCNCKITPACFRLHARIKTRARNSSNEASLFREIRRLNYPPTTARQHAIFRTGQQPPNCSVSWRESRELFPYRPPRPINPHSLPLRLTTSERDKRAERTNVVQTKLPPPPKKSPIADRESKR